MKISKTCVIASAVFLIVSAGCIKGKAGNDAPAYNDGTYKITVKGRNAPIELEMIVSGGKPSAINVLSEEESFFAQPAEELFISEFLKGKKVEKIDAVSGATVTSDAMREGINALCSQALSAAQ